MKRIFGWLQWPLFALFLLFIGRRGWELWRESDVPLNSISWGWFALGIPCVLLSWLTCAWFWRHLMLAHRYHPPWGASICAHYCGQLGKYVPGKGMVLLIRAGLVRPYGVPISVGAATATYETLLSMGAGLLVAICLVPIVLPSLAVDDLPSDSILRGFLDRLGTHSTLVSLITLVLAFLCLPLVSWVMNILAAKMVKLPHQKDLQPILKQTIQADDQEIDQAEQEIRNEHIRTKDLAIGTLVLMSGWFVQSLSLGAVLLAMGVNPTGFSDWLLWTMAYSLGTVIGFLAIFAPGGIGVREAVLVEVLRLSPAISNQQALTAAVLLRVLMFLTDLGSGLVCYYLSYWFKTRWQIIHSPNTTPASSIAPNSGS